MIRARSAGILDCSERRLQVLSRSSCSAVVSPKEIRNIGALGDFRFYLRVWMHAHALATERFSEFHAFST